MRKLRMMCVVGARPNFIKLAALLDEAGRHPEVSPLLVNTGQHSSPDMSEKLFRDLELPRPDINLKVSGGTHTQQTARIMKRLEPVMIRHDPDVLVVVGDVNSTMAAALVAAKSGIPIAHVEAGLRSFDRHMPEEVNRIVTDALAEYLFASEPSAVANLQAEGIARERIFFVGNVMIDTLLRFRAKAASSPVLELLGVAGQDYAVATLHRPSNADAPDRLRELFCALGKIAERLPVIFPVHPRTRQRLEAAGITNADVRTINPMGYLDFVKLMSEARMVLTDSGGIQEETTILGTPCLTLRENTERPITIQQGTNILVGLDPEAVLRAACECLAARHWSRPAPPLWDGKAASRIMNVLLERNRAACWRAVRRKVQFVPKPAFVAANDLAG